jgi:hypothetical protein
MKGENKTLNGGRGCKDGGETVEAANLFVSE